MTKEESNQNGDMELMRRLTRFNQKPVPVFLQQINSDTFLKTTENYQNGIIHSFLNILESAIRDGVSDKRINSLIGDANNSLKKSGHQIVYERDGGDSFNLYFR